ncbi:NAD(P)H-dependent oxidoreductase [Larkinella sp. C7]|uniref:NAD(P)H-dependent oxidoreductase n=1 Tax=Larkinella sp. C7 TaxID=2576607 RepID=UPI0011111BAB|nr:NAD(P)H-dependent oxidoreductase [Larkinella sp. C7]
MKIYILLAHPDSDTFNGRIADAYENEARRKGHEVRRQNLGEMHFDPILWKGYKTIQELEPDLKQAQENIIWCAKWVIIYPIWWGSVPALFKGFLDRTLYSGFAYKYHTDDPFWDKLLKGRSAHVITTCDAPWWWIWWQYRNSDINTVRRATLEFCGISPVRLTRIGRMKYLNDQDRLDWLARIVKAVN